ncbi:hypothetical protein [Teichococcus wenyumeiae]|uniref:hypothetical protein n=1 Tax=Teichococcus wenyumeiae TaxID=2478470 RepID=UPI00346239B4
MESGFSQHKRRLSSTLTARGRQAQSREFVLRVLTHNLMILRSSARRLQQSKRALRAALTLRSQYF